MGDSPVAGAGAYTSNGLLGGTAATGDSDGDSGSDFCYVPWQFNFLCTNIGV